MKYTSLLVLLIMMLSCNNKKKAPLNSIDNPSCYEYIHQKDTVELEILTQDNSFTGNLTYNLYEKDKNTGTITGIITGDTLVGTYKFQSEGTLSARQVVFLKKGVQLVEGYGEIQTEELTVTYKDISKLDFSGSLILTPVKCNK